MPIKCFIYKTCRNVATKSKIKLEFVSHRLNPIRDRLQIPLVILSEMSELINFYSPWNHQKSFFDNFRTNRSFLIRANSLNITSGIWRRSLIKIRCKKVKLFLQVSFSISTAWGVSKYGVFWSLFRHFSSSLS